MVSQGVLEINTCLLFRSDLPFQRNTGSLAAHHNGRHCAEYYRYVERILERASHDKVEVLNALSLIRGELLSGAALLQECR